MLALGASAQSGYHATLLALVIGLVIGVCGHITRSRTLILTGILIIGAASAYFTFVLSRVT